MCIVDPLGDPSMDTLMYSPWYVAYVAIAIFLAAGVEQMRLDTAAQGGTTLWSTLLLDGLIVLAYAAGWISGRHRPV